MNVKGVSFSKYSVKVNIYEFEKLDLFAFLFTRILLCDSLDKEKRIIDYLSDLDIKGDLYYLFNNIYYKLIDNLVIKDNHLEDIDELRLQDIVIDNRFISYLKEGYFPILKGEVEKEFVYDYMLDKVVLEKEYYNESNVCVLKVDNSKESIEKIINDNKKGLFDLDKGLCILSDYIVDPYYFKINTENLKKANIECVVNALKDNSLYLNDSEVKGEYLSNNIYFTCLLANKDINEYCKYMFINDKEKEFEVDNNKIYVSYNINGDFIDLINKESYVVGKDIIESISVSTYKKSKIDISDFKLYLIKNKNKFTNNISKIIEMI